MTWRLRMPMSNGKWYGEGNALSTETLPTDDIFNGSKMEVLDVANHSLTIHVFDGVSSTWVPVATVSAD